MAETLLQVDDLSVCHGAMPVLDRIGLTLARGETLALVGPSGCGKSTLARALLRLIPLTGGTIRLEGQDWLALRGAGLRRARAKIQMVFQDPLSAFNPRASVEDVLREPLRIHGIRRSPAELLDLVGLDARLLSRGVHAISGGQRQRVALARALASKPSLIILDEAVSALDVTVRGSILRLLSDIQQEEGTSYLFITHDLAVAAQLAHRIAVMERGARGGRIVETGPTRHIIQTPQASITKALIDAVPVLHI
ncbi:ABC transporter ATP-binding protein [Daeguia caeni]|uniref:ABC transporter ATP-binding protein n=1 Tax=Daeguia caeni TaxID=439612 RepID=A0ABV9H2D1_9HYPH